jgi:hypothetical protein
MLVVTTDDSDANVSCYFTEKEVIGEASSRDVCRVIQNEIGPGWSQPFG